MDAAWGQSRPLSPLLEKNPLFFPYGGPFSSCRDLYANLWLPTFLGLPPPLPTKISAGAHAVV